MTDLKINNLTKIWENILFQQVHNFFNNLAQCFRVQYLFIGQFNTKDYGTFTDDQYLFGILFSLNISIIEGPKNFRFRKLRTMKTSFALMSKKNYKNT